MNEDQVKKNNTQYTSIKKNQIKKLIIKRIKIELKKIIYNKL
jgi:hypothetical protein